MDTFGYLGQGFGVALSPYNLVTALCGTLIGTVVGLLPGLGPINGVALLIPIAFALGLPPESALILLAAVYLGCEYGGRISSILLNIPGEASTVMTTLDGYPMAAKAWPVWPCRCRRGVRSSARLSPPAAWCCLPRCWPSGRLPSARRNISY